MVFGGSGSLQGTVVKGGIGVLDSQFYNSFADDTSVQSALDDVNSAIDYVTSKGAIINADATLIQSGSSQAQDRITNLDREINSIKTEQLDESTAKSKAAKLKLSLAVNNINLTMQHNTSLIQNLVSLTEGQGPAIGVFGMMGY